MKRILTEKLTNEDVTNNQFINKTLTNIQEKGYQIISIVIRENRITIEYEDNLKSGLNNEFQEQEILNLEKATGRRLVGIFPMSGVLIFAGAMYFCFYLLTL